MTTKRKYYNTFIIFFISILLVLSIGCSPIPEHESGEKPHKYDSSDEITIDVKNERVTIMSSIPKEDEGVLIDEEPTFPKEIINSEDGRVTFELNNEPIYILDGELPNEPILVGEKSPFGIHPIGREHGNLNVLNARKIGLEWDRPGHYFFHNYVQKDITRDEYDWSFYDRMVSNMPKDINLVVNIDLFKPLPDDLPDIGDVMQGEHIEFGVEEGFKKEGSFMPADPEAYSKWVKALVQRYNGDGVNDMPGLENPIRYWQVENEPFGRGDKSPKDYTEFVRLTSKAIKDADPNAKVIIGGHHSLPMDVDVSGIPEHVMAPIESYNKYFRPALEELSNGEIDIVDIHYFGGNFDQGIKRVIQDVEEIFGEDFPIWITEFGTYSGQPEGFHFQSERMQAMFLVKTLTRGFHYDIEKMFWSWGLYEGYGDIHANDQFDNTGLIYNGIGPHDSGKGVKKLSFWSYEKIISLLQYWNGESPEMIESEDDIIIIKFPLGKNGESDLYIVWEELTKEQIRDINIQP